MIYTKEITCIQYKWEHELLVEVSSEDEDGFALRNLVTSLKVEVGSVSKGSIEEFKIIILSLGIKTYTRK